MITKFLAISLVLSVLFLPNIALNSSFAGRPEDILILLAFVHLIFQRVLYNTFYSKVLIIMFVLFFMSISLNERLLSINSLEFYNKIIKGMVSYTVFLLFMQEEKNYWLMIRILIISLIIYLAGNFLQLLQVSEITSLLAKYSNAVQMDAMEKAISFGRLPRLTGFISNPNNNAVFFVCMAGLILDLFFIKRKWVYLLLLLAIIAIIVFTQSRTMFVTLFIFFGIVAFINARLGLAIVIWISILIIKYLANIPYLNLLFHYDKLVQTNSFTNRLKVWVTLMGMIKQQPWLGFGGYKEYFYLTQTYPENGYILAWFRYGVIYMVVFCGMMIISVVMGITSAKRKIFCGYFMLGTNLALLIGSFSNTPFNNPRLFIFYSLVQAIFSASLSFFPSTE